VRKPGEKDLRPGGHAGERRRQFERERGLSEGRELDLEEDQPKEGAEAPKSPKEKEERDDEGT